MTNIAGLNTPLPLQYWMPGHDDWVVFFLRGATCRSVLGGWFFDASFGDLHPGDFWKRYPWKSSSLLPPFKKW